MLRKSLIALLLAGITVLSLWTVDCFSCAAPAPVFHISCPSADMPVLRTLPYYPPYHGVYARRRHFLCAENRRTKEEIQAYMPFDMHLVQTIGEVEERYVKRCNDMLCLLPESILYLFADYGWQFYVTAEDIAQTEFDGKYPSVLGVTDVQYLYIKVEDRDSATDATVLHEFGHFLDYCCNFPSEKKRFLSIMEQETAAAKDMGMDYGLGDSEEYFAESFLWYLTAPDEMEAYIPLTYDFIRLCLTEAIYEVHD
ncbi:MAG: hypothetical protein NC543_10370 [bacterium]|nr:hypothetical protein [bacterium]MCM1374284.1 hypothetical protein [Muribaculum sp.]